MTDLICEVCGHLGQARTSTKAVFRAVNHARKHGHTVRYYDGQLHHGGKVTPESAAKP